MDWFREVNHYCERADASYLSEPLDALSNASFLAAVLCRRPRPRRDPGARLPTVLLFAVGPVPTSTPSVIAADVAPIQLFTIDEAACDACG